MKSIYQSKFLLFCLLGIFLFSLLFLRSWHIIGPISFRNFAAIAIFVIAIRKTPMGGFSKNEKLYFTWLMVYIVISLISGCLFASEVYKNLIAYHMVSAMLIFSIPRLITDVSSIKQILIWFTLFYIINLGITWLQYINNPIGWEIGNYISPLREEKLERIESMAENDNMLSFSVCSGLNGFVVTNGQFVAGFLPFATLLLWDKKKISNIIGFFIAVISIVIAFCIQQRMCFFMSLLYFVVFFAYRVKGYKQLLLAIGILIGLLLFRESLIGLDTDAFGRLFLSEDAIRSHTDEMIGVFMQDTSNLLVGNPIPKGEHDMMYLAMSHNCVLDSMRRGGIVCFLLFIVLYCSLLIECFKIFILSLRNFDYLTVVFSISTIIFLLYSLTHSSGIPSGDVFTWFSYSFMLQSYTLNSNNPQISNESI